LRTQSDGSQIKVGDVARVALGVETYNMIPRFGINMAGRDSIPKEAAIVALYQAPGSNAVEVAANAIAQMEILKESFPDGMSYDVGLDTTLPITAGIRDIIVTLIIALVLVVLVVFIFKTL